VGWESPEDWENDQETLAEKIAKLKRKQDGEVDNPPSRIKKKPGVKPKRAVVTSSPVTATRRSTRGKGANPEHVLLSASKRAAEKDQGTPIAPASIDPFLVLPSVSDTHLWGVARDAGLGLDVSASSPSSLLSLIRAKELAQARLTEAALKAKSKEEEAQKLEQNQAENVANPASAAQDLSTKGAPSEAGTDPERITLADIAKSSRTTRRKKGEIFMGPRPNLRDTPARQARASVGVSK
jgi:post-segregation antitoxin (ccd killing protein)